MKKACRMHEVGKGQCGRDGLDLVMGGRVEEMQLQISRSIPEGAAKKNMEFEASAGSWMDVSHPDQSTLFAVAAVAGLVGGLLVGWRGASASAALSNVKVAVAKKSYGRVPTLVSIIGDFFKVSVATGTYDTR